MNDSSTTASTVSAGRFVRFTRWFFSWRTFKWILFCAIPCLVMLLLAIVWFEAWRGRRAWEEFRAEWEAKGERFDWRALIPPPVPDEENFAKTPLLADLFNRKWDPQTKRVKLADGAAEKRAEEAFPKWAPRHSGNWRLGVATDLDAVLKGYLEAEKITNAPAGPPAAAILAALERYRPVLDEWAAASKRPHVRYDLHYEHGAGMLMPHLTLLRSASRAYHYRAAARLALGQTDAALADVRMQFYLAHTLGTEPLLISQLVRIALLETALQDVWDGMTARRWSDEQLQELQRQLARVDALADYVLAMRGERDIFSNGFFDTLLAGDREQLRILFNSGSPDDLSSVGLRFMPRGWIYQNKLTVNRMFMETTLPMVDLKARRVFPEKSAAEEASLKSMRTTPYNVFCGLLFPALARGTQRAATLQTAVDHARIACAIERHRLAKGGLPETLGDLTMLPAAFLERLPRDVVTGGPIQYRREPGGRFILWSVGWDGKDDGGTVATKSASTPDFERLDWAWPARPAK
jgi:hypothetical protein